MRLILVAPRTDPDGAAYAGSQLQTQLYVNCRTRELESAVRDEFSELDHAQFEWRSPLKAERYEEYRDHGFLRALGMEGQAAAISRFWPTGGPNWDALAIVRRRLKLPGVLLVEGKSYPGELYGDGCGAKAGSPSRGKIDKALAWTQARIGVEGRTAADWGGRLYQDANRLAFLYWLNETVGVETWLVHLLFTGDPHNKPTTEDEWRAALARTNEELGIRGLEIPRAGHVFLPAGTRGDLIGHA